MSAPAPSGLAFERIIVALAALAGLLGVAAAAAAAHVTGGGSLAIASQFLLFHAAALFGLAALGGAGLVHRRLARLAAALLLAGTALFCGDLALRALAGMRLAPFVAPAGGFLLMLGWAAAGIAALRRN
jgi:uncharacterized membrane protein YgdD (TMEM256/DUF423 family)